jgi:hypothetical protein
LSAMGRVPIRVRRKVRAGNYLISGHCQDELEDEGFAGRDAIAAILNAEFCDKLTDDETHERYRIYDKAHYGRDLTVVVLMNQGIVVLKTAYES